MQKKELLETIKTVMNKAHNGRVSQNTLDYYRSIPVGDKIIAVVSKEGNTPVGVAACRIKGEIADRAILVVNSEHRRCAIAEKLGTQLLDEINDRGLILNCALASDNTPAVELVKKLGLKQVGSKYANRKSGSYLQLQFSNAEDLEERCQDSTEVFSFV